MVTLFNNFNLGLSYRTVLGGSIVRALSDGAERGRRAWPLGLVWGVGGGEKFCGTQIVQGFPLIKLYNLEDYLVSFKWLLS